MQRVIQSIFFQLLARSVFREDEYGYSKEACHRPPKRVIAKDVVGPPRVASHTSYALRQIPGQRQNGNCTEGFQGVLPVHHVSGQQKSRDLVRHVLDFFPMPFVNNNAL
jgi:hypothetical protein